MSLADVWNEIEFFFIDVTHHTQAEKNMEKYRKVAAVLENCINYVEGELENAKEGGKAIREKFLRESDAQGEFATLFDEKVGIWEEKRGEIIQKMENAIETARQRKTEAENKSGYWKGEVKREEQAIRNQLQTRKKEAKEK